MHPRLKPNRTGGGHAPTYMHIHTHTYITMRQQGHSPQPVEMSCIRGTDTPTNTNQHQPQTRPDQTWRHGMALHGMGGLYICTSGALLPHQEGGQPFCLVPSRPACVPCRMAWRTVVVNRCVCASVCLCVCPTSAIWRHSVSLVP
jgi:hypothetical protein